MTIVGWLGDRRWIDADALGDAIATGWGSFFDVAELGQQYFFGHAGHCAGDGVHEVALLGGRHDTEQVTGSREVVVAGARIVAVRITVV
jgi:hypothetical protein